MDAASVAAAAAAAAAAASVRRASEALAKEAAAVKRARRELASAAASLAAAGPATAPGPDPEESLVARWEKLDRASAAALELQARIDADILASFKRECLDKPDGARAAFARKVAKQVAAETQRRAALPAVPPGVPPKKKRGRPAGLAFKGVSDAGLAALGEWASASTRAAAGAAPVAEAESSESGSDDEAAVPAAAAATHTQKVEKGVEAEPEAE